MVTKNNISDLKTNILADAISAVDIIDVEIIDVNENSVHLYIKTGSLDTVNSEVLSEICKKHSNDEIYVSFNIPDEKIIDGNTTKNVDKVCIFIEVITALDFESFVAFG